MANGLRCARCKHALEYVNCEFVVNAPGTTADGLSSCPPDPDADRFSQHRVLLTSGQIVTIRTAMKGRSIYAEGSARILRNLHGMGLVTEPYAVSGRQGKALLTPVGVTVAVRMRGAR